ncbi:hypothetical protein QFZ66_007092 [Streptomyces sp. B4I13]|uniref:hypothetical protein n=1 Tax=Streptomyces sp. B4I13 TaxID=3042271 RepID=UPI00277D3DDA|nr:hypothetical protein [Streptomyces sp. B4I13]MDQ0963214.1 hypothetical protein [Streptomyces sp. B4I13]
MGTAERREASEDGAAAGGTALRDPVAPEDDSPNRQVRTASAGGSADRDARAAAGAGTDSTARQGRVAYRPLWVEEPAKRRRMPDPVRTAAVRAVLVIAVTLIQAMVAFLCTLAGSWLAFPMVISSVVSTVLATWGALDVWVTRQVWNQRNGVVSTPSSTARALRREQRRARRQERTAQRAQERIHRQSGAGQLSHP